MCSTLMLLIYWGDDTVDSATCKIHSQLHDVTDLFGDQMGYTTETGERGLKVWAKGASKTALKHGSDKFMESISHCIAKRHLFNGALNRVRRKQATLSSSSPDHG